MQSSNANQDEDLKVPSMSELSIAQMIMIGILYVILILLVSFIIYISATWNKDRTNEYTWGQYIDLIFAQTVDR